MNRKKIFNLVTTSIISALVLLMSFIPQMGYIQIGPVAITIIHIPILLGIIIMPFTYSIVLGAVFGFSSFFAALMYAKTPIDLAFINPLVSIVPRIIFVIFAWGLHKFLHDIDEKISYGKIINFTLSLFIIIFLTFYVPYVLHFKLGKSENYAMIYQIILLLVAVCLIEFLFYNAFFAKRKFDISIFTSAFLSTLFHTLIVILFLVLYLMYIKPNEFNFSHYKIFLETIIPTNAILEISLATFLMPIVYSKIPLERIIK